MTSIGSRRLHLQTVAHLLRRSGQWTARHKALVAGAIIVSLVVSAGLFAPFLAPMDPTAQQLARRLEPPCWLTRHDACYVLGSDGFGRDVLSRILYGLRISFIVVATAIVVSGFTGTALGLLAGYREGRAGMIIMRIVDMQLAMPSVLLAIIVVGIFGASLPNLVIVLALSGWVTYARIMYGEARSIKHMEYVLAARSVGASDLRIIRNHVLRNVMGAILVVATLQVGWLMLFEAGLSFLGLGVQPPTPSLGSMLSEGRNVLAVASWLATFPGASIVLAVLGINFLGNGLREILDPKLKPG